MFFSIVIYEFRFYIFVTESNKKSGSQCPCLHFKDTLQFFWATGASGDDI